VRKIAATYVFPANSPPIKNGMVVCDSEGKITDVVALGEAIKEKPGLEYYSGILTPGFINAHCHLELSHLKNKIEEKKGIGNFIGKINQLRNADNELVEKAIRISDKKMWAAGIAGVGDISNSFLTLETKQISKIFYHTFVETFGFLPERADRAFNFALTTFNKFPESGLNASIVPHSPYSVSKSLFSLIKKHALTEKSILSIHSLESTAELQFFNNGSGPVLHHLQKNLLLDVSHWIPDGKNPLLSVLEYLPPQNPLLLVHNTFLDKPTIVELKKHRKEADTFFVLCPNSNLYIENTLPAVSLLKNEGLKICLGTDSLASNRELSILSEMQTIQNNFPDVNLEHLIRWACVNGSEAIGAEKILGSFEAGKQPGINLITGIDFKQMRLTPNSHVKRLV